MNVSKLVIGREYMYAGVPVIFEESHEESEDCCGFPIFVFSGVGTNGKTYELCTHQVNQDVQEIRGKHQKHGYEHRQKEHALAE